MKHSRLSVVDQRLASKLHQNQIETIVRTESMADVVDRVFDEAIAQFMGIVTDSRSGDIASKSRDAGRVLTIAFEIARASMQEQMRRLAYWSHGQFVNALAAAVPRQWFRAAKPDLALVGGVENTTAAGGGIAPPGAPPFVGGSFFPGSDGPSGLPFRREIIKTQRVGSQYGARIAADFYTEPLANARRMTDQEWAATLRELIVPPPAPETVERIIQQPINGVTWQERFQRLSSLISNPEGLAAQLISGYAQGENLDELRKRIEPLVGNVKSSARRIARTEGLRVAEQQQRESWGALGDMVMGVQILAVLDQNTRPHHASRNGTIYYKNAADGSPTIDKLPNLPDEPNCRCWSSPVLRPPDDFAKSKAVQASFANAAGAAIPDPSTYDDWFNSVDEGRRKMAVGAERYNIMARALGNTRSPEWTDFLYPDGTLLSRSELKNEAPFDRAVRKQFVAQAIQDRKNLIQQVSARGFFSDAAGPRGQLQPAEVTRYPLPKNILAEKREQLTQSQVAGKRFTRDERQAMHAYTVQSSELNGSLRRTPKSLKSLNAEQREHLVRLEAAIDKAGPLPEPTIVYRGIDSPEAGKALLAAAKRSREANRVWALNGLVSHSVDQQKALERSSGGVMIEVRAKSGAFLAPFSDRPNELELLHKHRQNYRVLAILEDVEFATGPTESVRKTVIQLEQMP